MEDFTTNESDSGVVFEPDPTLSGTSIIDKGSVYFNAPVKINDKLVKFKVPVFFNDDALIPNYTNDTLFYEGVGFNKNLSTYNSTRYLGVKGSMWIKRGLETRDFSNGMAVTVGTVYIDIVRSIKVRGNGIGRFYYTDALPIWDGDYNGVFANTPCAKTGINDKSRCFDTSSVKEAIKNIAFGANPSTFTADSILRGLGMVREADSVAKHPNNINKGAEVRMASEPTLNPNIPGKEYLKLSQLANIGGDGNASVSLNDIEQWYKKYPESNPEYKKYYNEGHLLVRLDGNISFSDATTTTKTFDNKIAFIVDDGYQIQSRYYNSGDSASTLIYVGQNGVLTNFGCDKSFRGLIYIDEKNHTAYEPHNTFTWGNNCKIDGAVLLKGKGRVNWNSSPGGPAVFTRNDDILKAFTGFIPGYGGSEKEVSCTTRIVLIPLGYYYNLK